MGQQNLWVKMAGLTLKVSGSLKDVNAPLVSRVETHRPISINSSLQQGAQTQVQEKKVEYADTDSESMGDECNVRVSMQQAWGEALEHGCSNARDPDATASLHGDNPMCVEKNLQTSYVFETVSVY